MKTHRWNPYLVGALIGVLSILTFALADKPIGISTGIAQAAGACALPVLGADGVTANTYWAKKAVPAWDYGSLFVLGSFFGALVSSLMSGSFKLESVPSLWRERFGPSVGKRLFAAFIGGVVIIFGARLADGCTSGHGISGSLQLAVSSWTFFIAMFISGIVTAFLLFRSTSKS
ncbi:YeeE/YedE thiosulfate transporter family protein [Prosthecobacter sp.]|uniref:YeeE/YedE thiosulfate transporter family protein n=1 Tax=Prosthecobacter sp. TaxID=1965333 RepID=UPI002486F57C|nr:YeeE/YedE thiosulfate transporter family protein [Prosthecobacter sp.]MDI1314824.1 YeeE/YedE thiosulfate transporter family protein [Prosthecobacter sp.]